MLPVLAYEGWRPAGIEAVGFTQIRKRKHALVAQ